jgi:hypothetical protein
MKTRGAIFLLLVIAAACAVPGLASAPLPREQLYSLLNEANEAFRQANTISEKDDRAAQLYDKAILLYQKIVDQGGIRNGGLYYNLANAYLLKNDVGRAILNYRRAEKLDGSDLNIRKNLAFARSRRIDKVEVRAEKRVMETLFFWHYDISLRTRLLLVCILAAALCIGLTATIWLGRRPAVITVAVLSGTLSLCFLASVIVEARHRASVHPGVITAAEVVARQGDGPNYLPSFKDPLHAGTEFELIEQRPGWFHITLSNGSDAWIPDNAAGLI